MELKQFYDENLSHASYAVLSENEMAVIDPARDPTQYYEYAKLNNAKITVVIETHPHADFVSSHLEISKTTGAGIYVSKLLNPDYKFIPFDEGDELKLGKIFLIPMNTPGHSPDSISILIRDEDGKQKAILTGDTLFVGDVGRPDLREKAGAINKTKNELARMMYRTIHDKLLNLKDDIMVYPAHGAGSLCGKSSSIDTFTSIGKERKENYALQPMSEDRFVDVLLKDQSYIPKYFGYAVEMNRTGAPDFGKSIENVKRINSFDEIEKNSVVVDVRAKQDFIKGHYPGAINILQDKRFETYLGTVIGPEEKFYLIADNDETIEKIIRRAAKIGYELNIKGAVVHKENYGLERSKELDLDNFRKNTDEFTILDVRNKSETDKGKIFRDAFLIPLNELRDRYKELPSDRPIVVHCAAGVRSAAASSILEGLLETDIYDLSENVKSFSPN